MAEVNVDKYLWFNGVEDIDQNNWGRFWQGVILNGIVPEIGNELVVSAPGLGMSVQVNTGAGMMYGVRGIISQVKTLAIAPAHATLARADLVVMRAVFGDYGESYVALDVKSGTPSGTPAEPSVEQTAGTLWEIPLARVAVAAGVVSIGNVNLFDRRTLIGTGGSGSSDGFWDRQFFG